MVSRGMKWIELAQDRERWALVSGVINLRVA